MFSRVALLATDAAMQAGNGSKHESLTNDISLKMGGRISEIRNPKPEARNNAKIRTLK